MKTLYLLRHAKSGWDDPSLDDHDRPLDFRGERAALVIGRYTAQRRHFPDLILCSTARRAADTLSLVMSQWPEAPNVKHERALYLAGEDRLLARLGRVAPEVGSVMMVGHNPDLQQLTLHLAGKGDAALRKDLELKFPTAGLAILKLPADAWTGLLPGIATLITFTVPKSLV